MRKLGLGWDTAGMQLLLGQDISGMPMVESRQWPTFLEPRLFESLPAARLLLYYAHIVACHA